MGIEKLLARRFQREQQMNTTLIRDSHGNILGWINAESSGSQLLYNQHGNYLGMYEARGNLTLNQHGNYVGPGNVLMMLGSAASNTA